MQKSTDILIAGGGLSALMLAYYLKKIAPDFRVKILEKRLCYSQDKHWSFWLDKREAFDFRSLISHRYPQWSAKSTINNNKVCYSKHFEYCIIRSEDFYAHMMAQLGECVDFDAECLRVAADNIQTSVRTYHAPMVMNAMPPESSTPLLYQQFYGWVIETQDPVFDMQSATLMDFSIAQPQGACGFMYVLPLSSQRALVEPTAFTKDSVTADWFSQAMEYYLAKENITQHRIVEEEQGCLPLFLPPFLPAAGDGFPIGARAGWIRPSTGYAFLNTLRCAKTLAQYISNHHALPKHPLPAFSKTARWMDAVFLAVMRQSPEIMPDVFVRWFESVPCDQLVRFLQDQGRVSDALAIILHSAHKQKFLRQLWTR